MGYNPAVGFFRGFLAPFRGGLYVLRHPLKRYLLVPFVLSVGAGRRHDDRGPPLLEPGAGVDGLEHRRVLGGFFLGIMTVVGGVVLFLIAQPLLLAVFSDQLSERVERDVLGKAPDGPVPHLDGARAGARPAQARALRHRARGRAGPDRGHRGPGHASIGIALGGLSLAYDGFDYPLARRGASFGAKWAFLARHPGLTIGYGIGATVLYLIPFAVFVASPFAAVGATLAYIDLEKVEKAAPAPATVRKKGQT